MVTHVIWQKLIEAHQRDYDKAEKVSRPDIGTRGEVPSDDNTRARFHFAGCQTKLRLIKILSSAAKASGPSTQ